RAVRRRLENLGTSSRYQNQYMSVVRLKCYRKGPGLSNASVRNRRVLAKRSDLLNAGEQFNANTIVTPDPNTVEAPVQDVFAMRGAFHEGMVNICRGCRRIDASC